MRSSSTHATGSRTEAAAAAFLTRLGWVILARNWRWAGRELDIIARDGETLVFVEVKARRSDATYLPEEAIDRRKIERLLTAGRAYVDAHEWDGPCRFDVVAVSMSGSGQEMRLIREAFGA
ncbi:MAG: YraN family protein [Anaerolineae bacterium]